MKILMLADYVENYNCPSSFKIRHLTGKKISERGHKVTYAYPSNNSRRTTIVDETDNFRTISTPGLFPRSLRTGGFSVLDIVRKSRLVFSGNFDIIHVTCGHRPAQLIPSLLGKYLKKSVIVDEWWEWYGRGGFAEIRKGVIGKLISCYDVLFELPAKSLYDGVISITSVLKSRLKKNSHVMVLHGGAETGQLNDYDIHSAREALNLSDDLFIIGMSNLGEDDYEDNRLLFDAFCRLEKDYDNIRLFVTGEKKYLLKFIETVPYRDKIIYKGWLEFDDYNRYLSACNIFVLPFRNIPRNSGRWPNKIGDYLCLNRPVISNPTGDLRDLFENYNIGFICDETEDAFYQLLRRMLCKEIDLSKHHSDSRSLANDELDFDKRIDSILRFYDQCLMKS